MLNRARVVVIVAFAAVFAVPMRAATYIVPSDAELIQRSDDIVIVTAVSALSERTSRGGIVTRYTLRVMETLKGPLAEGAHLVVTENGGVVGDRARIIPGTPEYEPGDRYLVFTSSNRDDEPTTYGMSLGQFHIVEEDDRTLALRLAIHGFDQNWEEHRERARDLKGFVAYIRDTVAQRGGRGDYFVANAHERQIAAEHKIAANAFTRTSYLLQAGGQGFRWQTPTQDFVRAGTQPGAGNGPTSVSVAFGQWNSTASSIDYSDAGVDETATGGLATDDGKNGILFNDPNGEVGSAAGIGGVSGAGSHMVDGETFWSVVEGDVVINNQEFTQSCLNSVMTHEVGHTLGFRHSDTPPVGGESSSNAIMESVVSCGLSGSLQTYDDNAATTVYGSGPVCNAPAITTQPAAVSNISLGETKNLSVVATGSGPLSYQWYSGTSPDTSSPIAVATTSSLNVTPQGVGTYNLWVRVSNACSPTSPANSNTAVINVSCANPAITAHPQNVTITQGQSTQLQVTATGSALSYQWFKGEAGITSNPVGTNSNKLTVSPSETSKYWVRVNSTCGPSADSNVATVTVNPCAEITVNPPTATPLPGVGNFSISVVATSTAMPLTYTWFRGGTPGFGGTSLGNGQTKSVNVTTATNFWARIQNGCGRVTFSSVLTLAACTLPSITTQPSDLTINSGQSANLSIVTSAGATVKWYRGLVGDKSNQAGAAANVTVGPLTATTQFWAEVSNACGAVSSRQVTVTVNELAELVPMLNSRFFVQVRYKNQFDNGKEGKLLGRSLFSTSLSETAVFTFGDANVVELMVRLSDARPFDNHIHVFLGGLSDVEFFVVVTDSLSGIVREYGKPANQLIGVIDRSTFPAAIGLLGGFDRLLAPSSARVIIPTAESSTIHLLNNRFEVRMRYRNPFTSPPGEGYMNARSIASSPTTETAVFFFDENVGSAEWMVRFSDARPFADRIDMFHGGLSDVEFTIEVHDTQTGSRKEYHKPPFSLLGLVDRDSYVP